MPGAARDAAPRRFGSVALIKDDCRESWGMRAIDMLTQDVRFALRNLRKYPSYTAIVLLTLGLGRTQTDSLDAVVAYHQMDFNLLGRGEASRVQTGVISANFFDVLGVTPLLGRSFREDDDSTNAPAVLILSYAYWQSALGGDPDVIGRTFEINDRVHTVVGVLPPIPQFPQANLPDDVFMPPSACRSARVRSRSRTAPDGC